MRLPDGHRAIVTEAKIVDYLLSTSHPDGQYKATFFRRLGFSPERWEQMADALRRHAQAYEVVHQDDSPFGTWYTVEGELETPRGTRPSVRAVWIVDRGATLPRLVTAYPMPRRRT